MVSLNQEQVLHVRFNGRSFDVALAGLAINAAASDAAIKRALASQLDLSVSELDSYTIDRHANGNLTLRPEAVFG